MTRLVRRKDLKENMIVYGDVMNSYGGVVVNSGTVIDKRVMELFASNGIFEVRVLDTSSVDEKIEQLETHLQEIKHTRKFKEINHKYSLCYANIENQFQEVITRNRQVDKEQVIQGINNVLEKVDNTYELFDALYGMQLKQKKLYMHSLNTALISNVFARWLKFSEEEVNDITLAGLFHDIGMLVVPEEVLAKKEDKLTKREREILDHHPIYGYRYLLKSKLNRQVGLTALTHHEKLDGSGYPLQVMSQTICTYSKIVSIADAYDELTLTKEGARNPFSLIGEFQKSGIATYDPKFIMVFLSGIMDTYVGSDILLSDGTVGRIVYVNRMNMARPTIKCGDEFLDLTQWEDLQIVKFV